jgi:hypothetical protein
MSVKTAIGISLALLTAPLAAHSVETAKGNWTNIPLLARHHTVRLSDDAMATIDAIATSGKCRVIGNGKRIDLDMDFLVEFARDNSIKRVIVEQIGCPEVEQIAATATSQAADKGWLKPTGENETGWYRGSITYELR